ncbi:MAG: DUF3237 family protein [Gaiellaceae bacterium]
MRLEPLYRIRFSYPEHYFVEGSEFAGVFFAEGRCEGSLTGRFRGMNHPRLRPDDVYLPDLQGVIQTDDGAAVAFDIRGFGRARDYGREVVGTITHSCGDERYAHLNDALCVLSGEGRDREIRLEVAEVVWEPLAGGGSLPSSA